MAWFRWLTSRPRGQPSWERGQHCMRPRTKPSLDATVATRPRPKILASSHVGLKDLTFISLQTCSNSYIFPRLVNVAELIRCRKRDRPETVGGLTVALVDVKASFGSGSVKMTPALVPTHSRSRQASSAVTRRHAILCWRMMSSATVNKHTPLDP